MLRVDSLRTLKIENADNTTKESSDTKETLTKKVEWFYEKEVQQRANMRTGCEALEPELETLRRSRGGLHHNKGSTAE